MNESDYETVDNMERYGGSFVKALSLCIRRADPVNLKKLKQAFPNYFEEYHPSKWSLEDEKSIKPNQKNR